MNNGNVFHFQSYVQPPYCNTGVEPTSKRGVNSIKYKESPTGNRALKDLVCLFDWLSFTIKKDISVDYIITEFLKMNSADFIELDKGNYGYKRQVAHGGVRIYLDGKEEMGVHIQLSGQGCRQVEETLNGDWLTLFKKVIEFDGTFTRCDIAVDDRIGLLDINKIQEKTEKKEYVSRFKNWSITTSCKNDSNRYGKSIYFGSAESDIRLRFYDKAVEQGVDGHWVRTELQLRDERANNAILLYLSGKGIGEIVAGVLKNYIRFVEPSHDSNKWRWNTSEFWDKFIADAEVLKLTEGQKRKTLDDVYLWISKSVAPSLALLLKASDGDLTVIYEIISEGSKRLKPKHYALLVNEKERGKQRDLILSSI